MTNLLKTERNFADVVLLVPPTDAVLPARLFARSLLCHGVGCVGNDQLAPVNLVLDQMYLQWKFVRSAAVPQRQHIRAPIIVGVAWRVALLKK